MADPIRRRRGAAIVAVALVLAVAGCGASAGSPGGAGGARTAAARGCPARAPVSPRPPFSTTSLWNAPVPAGAAVDRSSPAVVGELSTLVAGESAKGVGPWINTSEYSVPVFRVAACQPRVPVRLDGRDPALGSALRSVPLPPSAQPAGGTDASLVVYQPSSDRLWEFWRMRHAPDGWHAAWGGAMSGVSSSPGYFHGPGPSRAWGASASGLALMGGLITPEELRTGVIDHALAMSVPDVRARQFARPAQRTDGRVAPPAGIPEGSHLRLDPALDLSKLPLSPVALALARAAQRYGIVVRDFSGNVGFYGEDPRGRTSDPWPGLLGTTPPPKLLAGFPWSRLQLLRSTLATSG